MKTSRGNPIPWYRIPWYRRIRHLAIAIAVAVVLPLAVTPASPAAAGPSYFTLRSKLNGKCLEVQVPGWDGQRANMWDCWGGDNQQWFRRGSEIVNRRTGQCLEILNVDPNPGSYVGVWGCWNGANQHWSWGNWVLAGGWELKNHLNGICLEIRDSWPHNGADVGMWGCWGGAATAWVEVPV